MMDARLQGELSTLRNKVGILSQSTDGLREEIRKLAEAVKVLTDKIDKKNLE